MPATIPTSANPRFGTRKVGECPYWGAICATHTHPSNPCPKRIPETILSLFAMFGAPRARSSMSPLLTIVNNPDHSQCLL